MTRTRQNPLVSIHGSAGSKAASSRLARRLGVVSLLAVTLGCSATDADSLGVSREELFTNDHAAYTYFVNKGLTNFQAAGVVGNLDQESGVDPTIHQNNGGVGRGIAQWSTGARWDTTPNDNVKDFATQKGQSMTSLTLQFDFMWYELTTFPDYGLADLKASKTLEAATQVVEDKFEGCVYANFSVCALPSRINFANGIFKAYSTEMGTGGSGNGGAGGSGGVSGANAGGAGGAVAGSSGATTGGSAGSSSAGAAGTDPGGAGSSSGAGSSAGGSGSAGSPTGSGGAGTAGSSSPSTAGSSTSATAGSSSIVPPAAADDTSSCAFSAPTSSRSSSRNLLLWASALFASTLTLRRRKPTRRAS
jgi:hypothetical protein